MRQPIMKVPLTWLFLVAIVCAAMVIIWALIGNSKPSNAVHIEGASMGRAGKGAPGSSQGARDDAIPTASGRTIQFPSGGAGGAPPRSITVAPTATVATISVYISGAVAKPGVYTLPEGARVQDAIAAAGGAMIQADLDGLNLAQKLVDEAQVKIARRGDAQPSSVVLPAPPVGTTGGKAGSSGAQVGSQPAAPEATPSAPVNINTASAAELEALPGIGPSLAARIVTDRQRYGPFKSVEDLTRVNGIKEGILAKIRPYVTAGP